MQEGEASDGVAAANMINIDKTITAKRMALLRSTEKVFASAEVSRLLVACPKGDKLTICKLSPVLKDNIAVQLTFGHPQTFVIFKRIFFDQMSESRRVRFRAKDRVKSRRIFLG
jgi:hypothetical protein